MSVYRRPGADTYLYDFVWRGERYRGTTHQKTKTDAQLVESRVKLRLRQRAGGIAVFDPDETPTFTDWAELTLAYQRQYIDRPDVLERTLRVVLEFWGAKPSKPADPAAVPKARAVDAPYHDLRLGDPIAHPEWILRFEQWMTARRVSGSTRNSYLSALSTLYRVALQPAYRTRAGVDTNPFRDIRRAPAKSRLVALTPEQVLAWSRAASYHVALAVTIGALAPKLRLQSILDLEWDVHIDAALTRLVVTKHKTGGRTGAPQVTPISGQLREVLEDARARYPTSTHVITFRGERVGSIKRGAKRAAEEAGLVWGRHGVTFHTLRHSVATLLAEMGLPEAIRKDLMGHTEIRTTQKYTHLAAQVQVQPHEDLSARLPLKDILLAKPRPKARGGNRGDSTNAPLIFPQKSPQARSARRQAS